MNAVELKRRLVTEAIQASGMTQVQLAEQMGVTQAYISKMKQGNAPLQRVLDLVERCGYSVAIGLANREDLETTKDTKDTKGAAAPQDFRGI